MNDIRTRIREAVKIADDGCWIWTRCIAKRTGYGRISVAGRTIDAHVASYQAYVGPVPAGLELDHRCRVRACVRPDHLEPVTHRVNMLRAPDSLAAINAAKTHCPQGHAYDEANTYVHRAGKRDCRICRRDAGRRSVARQTAAAA